MIIQMHEDGRNLYLTCDLGKCFSLLTALPGFKKWVNRDLILAPTGANIAHVMEHFPEAIWQGGADHIRDEYICLKQQEQNVKVEKDADLTELPDPDGYLHKTTPYRHQQQAFMLSRGLENFALFHEQGCGKGKVIIDTAAYRYERGDIDTLIVIAKNGLHLKWIMHEIPTHLPDRIPRFSLFYTNSWTGGMYRHALEAARTERDCLRIITFYFEGINSEKAQTMLEAWMDNSRVLLAVDESSKIKNPSAHRTKYLVKVGRKALLRRIMTGTPVTSGIENLYSQFLLLDHRILGYNSFYTFRARFCIMGGFENRSIISYKNVEELVNIVDGHSHRVLKKDCLDLPPKIYKRHPFDMSPSQRRLYDAYRTDAVEEVSAALKSDMEEQLAKEIAITKALRLHQIACGLTPTKDAVRLEGPNPRMEVLLEDIEDSLTGGNKVVVWARFKVDLREILSKLGKKAVGYFGEVPANQRPLNNQRFIEDDRVRVMVAHVQSAGYGLDFPAGTAIYHSNTSSLEDRLQSEDRCHGIARTQGDKVLYIDVEARRSVDRKIIRALRKHKELADQINQDPLSLFMEDDDYEAGEE